jgi:hypothetical protein
LENLDPETGRLKREGINLPDEERRYANSKLRWVPGALEGSFGPQLGTESASQKAHLVATYIINIEKRNLLEDKIALYNLLLDDDLLGYVDQTLEQVVNAGVTTIHSHIHDFALFLAKDAPDRGPVKFAIALLGILGGEGEKEIISILGRQEEFTLYSAVALSNSLADAEPELWQLAQKVDGWGKIQIVNRISSTDSPEIKNWLLLEGYRNNIMNEYLAFACATGGDLKQALSVEDIDNDLLDSAGEIIEALITGGPAQDINDYQDAGFVILMYLKHLEPRSTKLNHFVTADLILSYLTNDSNHLSSENGWNENTINASIQIARLILEQPHWVPLVEQGLASNDNIHFYLANRAAQSLGIDTWDVHWKKLQDNPLQDRLWFPVMERSNPENIESILDFAIRVLPFDQVAIGAADEMGFFGSEFATHRCLDVIVQSLRNYPNLGWPLIAASLQSPVIRNRNMALVALSKWDRSNWTAEIEEALLNAREAEPREDVKESIEKVVNGESII